MLEMTVALDEGFERLNSPTDGPKNESDLAFQYTWGRLRFDCGPEWGDWECSLATLDFTTRLIEMALGFSRGAVGSLPFIDEGGGLDIHRAGDDVRLDVYTDGWHGECEWTELLTSAYQIGQTVLDAIDTQAPRVSAWELTTRLRVALAGLRERLASPPGPWHGGFGPVAQGGCGAN
ncbi:MAG TPA: hypothetical protein VGM37_10735 [Armatimonadota bacterium]|jgi:hypothetical protein